MFNFIKTFKPMVLTAFFLSATMGVESQARSVKQEQLTDSQVYVWCKRIGSGTTALFQGSCPAGWIFIKYDV